MSAKVTPSEPTVKTLAKNRRATILVVSAGICVIALAVKMLHRKPDPVARAKELAHCLVEGNVPCIASSIEPRESNEAGWTPDNVRYVYEKIINPFWMALPRVGQIQAQPESHEGVAYQTYRLPNGLQMNRVVTIFSDGKYLASDDLVCTFQAMLASQPGSEKAKPSTAMGVLQGLHRYAPELQVHGVKGLLRRDIYSGLYQFVDWNTATSNISAALKRNQTVRS